MHIHIYIYIGRKGERERERERETCDTFAHKYRGYIYIYIHLTVSRLGVMTCKHVHCHRLAGAYLTTTNLAATQPAQNTKMDTHERRKASTGNVTEKHRPNHHQVTKKAPSRKSAPTSVASMMPKSKQGAICWRAHRRARPPSSKAPRGLRTRALARQRSGSTPAKHAGHSMSAITRPWSPNGVRKQLSERGTKLRNLPVIKCSPAYQPSRTFVPTARHVEVQYYPIDLPGTSSNQTSP